jgi:hypothetical protein
MPYITKAHCKTHTLFSQERFAKSVGFSEMKQPLAASSSCSVMITVYNKKLAFSNLPYG